MASPSVVPASSETSHHGPLRAATTEAEWEKVLWRRQPFPDNYVPPSFLAELDRLPPRTRPRLGALMLAALPISQHLCAIALFVAVFYRMLVRELGAGQVGWSVVGASAVGWALSRLGWGRLGSERQGERDDNTALPRATPLRSLVLPPLLLSLLAPVLGTLTSATTSDSIWPLAGGLFGVHLLLADFSTGPDQRTRSWLRRREREMRRVKRELRRSASAETAAGVVTGRGDGDAGNGPGRGGKQDDGSDDGEVAMEEVREKSLTSSLSLTSALSASIVLASRLSSTEQVFSLVLLAVALFAGWSDLAKRVREAGLAFSLALTCSIALLALSLLPHTAARPDLLGGAARIQPASAVFGAALVLANVLGPAALWCAWGSKRQRGGGWDVAVVRVRRDMERDRAGAG